MPSWIITALCGLRDAVNPCVLTTMTFFLFILYELKKRRISVNWYAAFFIALMFVASLACNLSVFIEILYSETFYHIARKFYLIAGIVLTVCGCIHFIDWLKLKRHQAPLIFPVIEGLQAEGVGRQHPGIILLLTLTAFIMTPLSTVWPINGYVLVYSALLSVPGRMIETYLMMFVYYAVQVVPLVAIFVFLSSQYFFRLTQERPALVKIIQSAVTLSLGTGLIYIFH
jgi:cytochrome c biogenesis protein CcdA